MTQDNALPHQGDPRDAVFDVHEASQNLTYKTGRSAITILLFAALKTFVALGSTAVLSRLVSPQEQGIFALAVPAVLVTVAFSEFGIPQAIVQRPRVTHRLASALMWIGIAVGLALMAIVALLGAPAARFFDTPAVAPVFVALSPYVLLSVLTAQYVALLRRQMRIRQIETGGLGATILASLLAIVAALLGAGYWALAVQLVMAEVLNLAYLLAVTRWLPSSPLKCRFAEARSALTFGGFLALERLMAVLTRNLQLVVIGRAFNNVDAGYFYRADTVGRLPQRRIMSPLSGAFLPSLSRLQDDMVGFREMYIRQVSRGNLIMGALGLVMCSCADALVLVILGPDWTSAAPILAWISAITMTTLTLNSFAWCLVASGKSRELFFARIVISLVLIAGLLLGAQLSLLWLVKIFVLLLILVQGGVHGALALKYTHLDFATLRRALGEEMVFLGIALPAALLLRQALTLPAVAEAFLVCALLLILYGLRLALRPDLRADVYKVFKRKL